MGRIRILEFGFFVSLIDLVFLGGLGVLAVQKSL